MSTNRLDTLKSMVEQNPEDGFARYGLAMEYVKAGDLERAIEEFETLLRYNASYAAGYFHEGQTFEKLGRVEDAKRVYSKGIEVTSNSADEHTRSELLAALRSIGG
jgi:tetratricopeptide (TPR) repeat protein